MDVGGGESHTFTTSYNSEEESPTFFNNNKR